MNSKILKSIEKIHPILWQIFSLILGIAVFALITTSRSPVIIRPLSMALRSGFGFIIPATTLVLYLILRIRGRLGDLLSLIAIMSLFALGLAGVWASGKTQSILLNGLIPISDATNYYIDAIRIQHGSNISNFSAMRPFFPGLLSFFLWISVNNLLIATAIFTAIAGLSCHLACREIKQTHGAEVSTFFLVLMFLYYRHHSGTTMSETLSVSLSLLGIASLWQGVSAKKEWITLFCIALIAFALNVRPGAMFVLPALLLWGGWIFRGQRRFSPSFFLAGAGVIGLTFILNRLMINILAGPNAIAFENFAWAFYGLASGGNSWTYVFEAHPELHLLEDSEVTPAIYRLAFDLIFHQPSLLLKGSFFYWRMFFSSSWYNAYSFVAGENYWLNKAARWSMYGLGGLGIFNWWRNRGNPYASLAILGALGVLTSVPFVPPTDAYRVRLYAATIPFFALLPAMGVSFLRDKINHRFLQTKSVLDTATNHSTIVLSLVLIAVMIASPILIHQTGQTPFAQEISCPDGMANVVVPYEEGTYFNVLRENVQFLDWMPDFHSGVFRRNTHDLADSALIEALESINPPSTIFYALDLRSNREALMVVETAQLPEPGTLIYVCGRWDDNPNVSVYRIFHGELVMEAP